MRARARHSSDPEDRAERRGFRQINLDQPSVHHDALEFPDGQIVLLDPLV